MARNKYLRIFAAAFFMCLCFYAATPKFYLKSLFKPSHTSVPVSPDKQFNSQATDDCDFEQYNKPAYFNIFRFISNFIPLRPAKSGSISGPSVYFSENQTKQNLSSSAAHG
jgi:hypothetical protein